MTETKWTPGPWRLHLVDDTTIIDANGRFVAAAMSLGNVAEDDYNNPDEWPILEANARLIAAAPEMADAIRFAIESGMVPVSSAKEGGASKHSAIVKAADMLRAALAKAEGRDNA